MRENSPITAEGLKAALKYLKENPSVVKFQEGGGYPPYLLDDPSMGQIQPLGTASPLDMYDMQNLPFITDQPVTYEVNPFMGGEGTPLNGMQPISQPTEGDTYLQYLQSQVGPGADRMLRQYKQSAGITGTGPGDANIGPRGELLEYSDNLPYFDPQRVGERRAERNERRVDRRENQDIRQFNRQNDRDPQGLFTGDNFQNPEGKELEWNEESQDWFVPSAKQERKEARREKMQSPEFRAGLWGASMIGHAVTDLMGGVRDAFSVAAMNKRNQYVMDWYNRKRKEDEQRYVPTSQTANANYLGGFSFGEKGGVMGDLPKYIEGGFENGDEGDNPPLNKKQQQAQYGYQIMNQLRGHYKHLDPESQQVIEPGVIDFGGKKKIKGADERGSTPSLSSTDFETYRVAGNQFVPDASQYESTGVSFGDGDDVVISFREHPKYGNMPVVIGTGKESMKYVKKYFNPHYANFQEKSRIGADQIVPYYTVGDDDAEGYQGYRNTLQQQAYGGLFKAECGGKKHMDGGLFRYDNGGGKGLDPNFDTVEKIASAFQSGQITEDQADMYQEAIDSTGGQYYTGLQGLGLTQEDLKPLPEDLAQSLFNRGSVPAGTSPSDRRSMVGRSTFDWDFENFSQFTPRELQLMQEDLKNTPVPTTGPEAKRYGEYVRNLRSAMLRSEDKYGQFGTVKKEDGGMMPPVSGASINDLYLQEGQYVEFEHGGKMYKGTVKKNKDGKIYI